MESQKYICSTNPSNWKVTISLPCYDDSVYVRRKRPEKDISSGSRKKMKDK